MFWKNRSQNDWIEGFKAGFRTGFDQSFSVVFSQVDKVKLEVMEHLKNQAMDQALKDISPLIDARAKELLNGNKLR